MGTVTSYHKGDMLFETRVGNHVIANDVPGSPVWGGKDRAPTPPDYFIASLGSCIAAFVVQYCQNAGIDSKEMSVDVNYDKSDKPAFLKNIAVTVNLPHADVNDRMEAIRRVSEHCTVHETISQLDHIAIEVFDRNAIAL